MMTTYIKVKKKNDNTQKNNMCRIRDLEKSLLEPARILSRVLRSEETWCHLDTREKSRIKTGVKNMQRAKW